MRKTVTLLNRIRGEVSETREKLHNCSEELESLTYEIGTMVLDDIRTDEGGCHTELMSLCRKYTTRINKAATEHMEAVKKYRDFFAC